MSKLLHLVAFLMAANVCSQSLRMDCYFSAVDEHGKKDWFQNFSHNFDSGSRYENYVGPYKVNTSMDESSLYLSVYVRERPLFKTEYNVVELRSFDPATKIFGENTSIFHEKINKYVQMDFFCSVE